LGPETLQVYSTLFARVLSILAGTSTVYLSYLVGRRVISQSAGLVAAAICAVLPYHVFNSAYSTNDVLTSFVLALLMLQLIQLYEGDHTRRRFVTTGIIFGILVGTKYTGGAALLMILTLYLWMLAGRRQAAMTKRAISKEFIVMGASSLAAFIATTPGLLIQFRAFVGSLNRLRISQSLMADPAPPVDMLLHMLKDAQDALSTVVVIAFVVSAVMLLPRSNFSGWRRVFLLSGVVYVAIFVGLLGASLKPRYLLTIVPIVAVTIAAAWQLVANNRVRWPAWIASGLVLLAIVDAAGHAVLGVYSKFDDSRTRAARYIVAHVEPGTAVALSYQSEEYRGGHRWHYPVVDFEQTYVEADMLDYPPVIVVSSSDTRKIEYVLPYLSEDLQWRDQVPLAWYQGAAPSPRIFNFYKKLFAGDAPYRLEAEFTGRRLAPVSFPAPTIRIYRRESSG
jgi:4-amino-4-deoxy-L-arabinose transferase-like glycosyltransferase